MSSLLTAAQVQDAAFFWPSFWSGSASGVITGITTGLVVGYDLLRYQRGIEGRNFQKACARELSLKLDQLRGALTQQDVLNIVTVANAIPAPLSTAIGLL
jgi:hypothetical protein